MNRKICFILVGLMVTGCFAGCGKKSRETLHQTALLQSLMLGDYYGSVSVKELKEYGDTGIGTFDKLNGELIMLDGEVYAALSDGTVQKMNDDVLIPFSDVTFLDNEYSETLSDVTSMEMLKEKLTDIINRYGSNYFYMVKINGNYDYINYRSEYAQKEPYKPLADVMMTDQMIFDSENISGTVVGLYCPDYMDGLNTAGWHFHFISDDKQKGGHVLDVRFSQAEAVIDKTEKFKMDLPGDEMFKEADMTTDLDEAITKVEKNE